jgi:hypothetical protein
MIVSTLYRFVDIIPYFLLEISGNGFLLDGLVAAD